MSPVAAGSIPDVCKTGTYAGGMMISLSVSPSPSTFSGAGSSGVLLSLMMMVCFLFVV